MPSKSDTLEHALMRAWMRRGPLALALWPLAQLFRALAAARRLAFRRGWKRAVRLPVPVVVVGNIFVGGTGKTPLTIRLVEDLRAAGRTPGVVSRGYGAQGGTVREVRPDSSAADAGDEPLLIARRARCPVFVGRSRAEAGMALLAAYPEVDLIVCDDGLQHYALARDVEIALFDARGIGNGWLLPAGPLRESPSRRRDFTVVNMGDAAAGTGDRPAGAAGSAPVLDPGGKRAADPGRKQAVDTGAAPAVATRTMRLHGASASRLADGATRPLASFAGQRLLAAAGIGNPARFFALLENAGLRCATLALPDHYDFRDDPFAQAEADAILVTEKDAVKCAGIARLAHDPRLWVVPVSAHLDGPLAEQILETLRGRTLT